jgi:hypothetical protein
VLKVIGSICTGAHGTACITQTVRSFGRPGLSTTTVNMDPVALQSFMRIC